MEQPLCGVQSRQRGFAIEVEFLWDGPVATVVGGFNTQNIAGVSGDHQKGWNIRSKHGSSSLGFAAGNDQIGAQIGPVDFLRNMGPPKQSGLFGKDQHVWPRIARLAHRLISSCIQS